MEQKALAGWLKWIIAGVGICCIISYAFLIPMLGQTLVDVDPKNLSRFYQPWLIFSLVSGMPVFAALIYSWQIAGRIGADRSFSSENAHDLKRISQLAAIDAGYVFVGSVVLFLAGMNHPGTLFGCLFIVFFGIAISVSGAALSHLVKKAADLQEENDLTI